MYKLGINVLVLNMAPSTNGKSMRVKVFSNILFVVMFKTGKFALGHSIDKVII